MNKIHKTDKNAKKCLLIRLQDRFLFSISAQQPIWCIVGCFRQYFVPVSKAFHANLTSFFQIHLLLTSTSGMIFIVILCICSVLHFLFYVQFDEAKQSIDVPCII